MLIQNVSVAQYEDVLTLEWELFRDEAMDRYSLVQYLRIFRETCFVAVDAGTVQGYALGLVKSTGEAWVTALACKPQLPRARHVAFDLAGVIAGRLQALNARIGYATTRRRSIVVLARHFNGRIVETVENYFLDGQPRHVLEFRPS